MINNIFWMKIVWLLLCASLLVPLVSAYMQFQLTRSPHPSKKMQLLKSQCQDPATITQQSKYIQVCFEKDIAYVFQFTRLSKISYLALDLTSPISWIKDDKCKQLANNKPCTSLTSNYGEKIKGIVRQKINQLINKIMDKMDDDSSKAIIEGSNEIVMGQVAQVHNLTIVGKNQGHLSKIIDIVLLGLYIIGEHDTVQLNSTNFISATKITPNLNNICDGAVSLRFDQASEKSFLNEVFDYMQTKDKIISVYLGKDSSVVTIGGMSPKYTQNGISSITRVKMEEDQKYGKLARMQALILQTQDDLHNLQIDSLIIFTLSASYIGFSQQTIDRIFAQVFPSTLKCKINNQSYVQCLNGNKQDVKILLATSLNLDLDTSMIHFEIKDLLLKNQGGKLILNIKETPNNHTVVGQPFFVKYYVYFDYGKNEVGYSLRKLTMEEHIISAITLIHFIMVAVLLGTCFILTSDPCKKIYYYAFMKVAERTQQSMKKTFKSYQPVEDEQEEKHKSELPRLEDVQGI